jgi:hypothetical protein
MRTHILLFTLVFFATRLGAQTYFTSVETGVSFGASQYFGDLNDSYGFKTIGPAFGLYARKHLSQYISVKLAGNYTHLAYSDKDNSSQYQKKRNLDFQTSIYEVALQAEFNFVRFVTGDPYHRFAPYLTGGVGAFFYDPYTEYQGKRYYLRSIGTEGQNAGFKDRKYSNVAVCFPIGAGVKYWIKPGLNVSFEIVDRLTTTDYIDDVSTTYVGPDKFPLTGPAKFIADKSYEIDENNPLGQAGKQRGNTSSFDQYLMAQVSVSWHFKTYHCPAALSDEMIQAY